MELTTRRPISALAALGVLTAILVAQPAGAQTAEPWILYGHDNATSSIVTIDMANGLARTHGPTGFASGASGLASARADVFGPGGMVIQKDSIFGLLRDETFNKDYVVVVQNETGAATKLVELDLTITGRGIAFGADGQTLYTLIPPGELQIIDTVTGARTVVGTVQDDFGNVYSGVSLQWDPISQAFLAFGGPNTDTLIRIDPSDAHATVIGTIGNFGACTLARTPGPINGPGGQIIPAGTWIAINTSTNDLHAITLNASASAIVDNVVIGGLGPNGTAVCGTAFALPELPTHTPTSTALPSPTPTSTGTPTSTPPAETPTGTVVATVTPRPTWTPPPTRTPRPTVATTPGLPTCVCEVVQRQVPPVVISDALANPDRYYGWRYPLDLGKPPSPANPPRECLALLNVSMPYHPLWNKPIWRVGCP